MEFTNDQNFISLCERCGVSRDYSKAVYEDLLIRYTEEHRSYHNIEHIDHMLGVSRECGVVDDAIEMAIWFHDVIYDPRAKYNERESADWFLHQYKGKLLSDFMSEVERLIMATDPTQERSGDAKEDLIVDIDLSVLGAAPSRYLSYATAVRQEYSFVPDDVFAEARSKILNTMLSSTIYVTEHFVALERQARSNMVEEIQRL